MLQVIDTMGPWNLFFFIPVVFLGSYYLVNLMLAVVSLAYEDESQNALKVKISYNIYFDMSFNVLHLLKKKLQVPLIRKKVTFYDVVSLKKKVANNMIKIAEQNRLKIQDGSNNISSTELMTSEHGIKTAVGEINNQKVEINEMTQMNQFSITDPKIQKSIQEGQLTCGKK